MRERRNTIFNRGKKLVSFLVTYVLKALADIDGSAWDYWLANERAIPPISNFKRN